jgi:hypothetical protein
MVSKLGVILIWKAFATVGCHATPLVFSPPLLRLVSSRPLGSLCLIDCRAPRRLFVDWSTGTPNDNNRKAGIKPRNAAVSDQTARRRLEDLRAAVNAYHAEHTLSVVPKITLPPKAEGRHRWLTRNEAARLLGAAIGYAWDNERGSWKRRDDGTLLRRERWIIRRRYPAARFCLIGIYSASKAGIRYRYYVSTPLLHGEAKTASAGSVSRVPAAEIEGVVVKSLKDHLAIQQAKSTNNHARIDDRGALAQLVARIIVHKDKLTVRLKSDDAADASDSPHGQLLTITWQKPPSRRSRQILLPHNASRSEVRPQQSERRARLVSAIAQGRRWLDEVVSGRVTSVEELCTRRSAAFGMLT